MPIKKTIALIEDDIDGVTVLVGAPDQDSLSKNSIQLWETFCSFPNKNFPDPALPGPPELDENGELYCTFNVSYPIRVAQEVVEDWLTENAKSFQKSATSATYSYE